MKSMKEYDWGPFSVLGDPYKSHPFEKIDLVKGNMREIKFLFVKEQDFDKFNVDLHVLYLKSTLLLSKPESFDKLYDLYVNLLEKYPKLERLTIIDYFNTNLVSEALKFNNTAAIQEFEKKRIDLQILDSRDASVFEYAIQNGSIETITQFINQGANLHRMFFDENHNIMSPLALAVLKRRYDVVDLLLSNGLGLNSNQDSSLYDELTPLTAMSWIGDIQAINYLIERGADPNAKDSSDYSPLLAASAAGHINVLQLLISKGATLDPQDLYPWTAAISGANPIPTINVLLSAGADLNVKSVGNDTLLMISIIHSKHQVLDWLLGRFSWDLDAGNLNGDTALMKAAGKGDLYSFQKLLLAGATRNLRNFKGYSADEMLLLNPIVINSGYLKYVLDHGVNVNVQDSNGETALMIAIRYRNSHTMRILLDYGADTSITNFDGETGLLIARKTDILLYNVIIDHLDSRLSQWSLESNEA